VTRTLDFFPDWRRGNPFLSMLFARLGELDVSPRPVDGLRRHLVRAVESNDPGVLNVHWTTPVLRGAVDEDEARTRTARLSDLLDAFGTAGGRLVWTVHNALPHDAAYPEAEAEVCRVLARHADLVHVLSDQTGAAVAPYFELDPARTVTIPHSSYLGVYHDRMRRRRARRDLGLAASDRGLVTLGRIRPYKGLDRLLDAWGRAPLDDPSLRLLVAGKPSRDAGTADLAARLAKTPGVLSSLARVPAREVQRWMRAADLAVLPYDGILNSGSFLLAETFGLPIVAPRSGALVSREGAPHVRLFDPPDLAAVVAGAVRDLVVPPRAAAEARESALATAAANPPELMAQRFATAVAPLF